jgi:hypothetical protein
MAHSMNQKTPTLIRNDNMKEEQVNFKVTLLEEHQDCSWSFEKIEVRRFVVPKDRSTSMIYLKERVRSLFGNQIESGVNLQIHWKDKDGDFIRVRSDQELLIGLLENKNVFNLTVLAGNGTLTVNEDNADSLAHVH